MRTPQNNLTLSSKDILEELKKCEKHIIYKPLNDKLWRKLSKFLELED